MTHMTRVLAIAGLALALGAGAVGTVEAGGRLWRQTADADQLARLSGTTAYRATPATVWSWTSDPEWVCSLVPTCVGASGTADRMQLQLSTVGQGYPSIPGLSTVPVDVRLTGRQAPSTLTASVSVDNAAGTYDQEIEMRITPAGRGDARSNLSLRTVKAEGKGPAGTAVLAAVSSTLAGQLAASSERYFEYAAFQPVTAVTLRPVRTNAKGLTLVQATASTTFPSGFEPPATNGTVRLSIGGKQRCVTRMTESKATCWVALAKGKKKTAVTAALNGTLTTGTDVNVGVTGYLSPRRAK